MFSLSVRPPIASSQTFSSLTAYWSAYSVMIVLYAVSALTVGSSLTFERISFFSLWARISLFLHTWLCSSIEERCLVHHLSPFLNRTLAGFLHGTEVEQSNRFITTSITNNLIEEKLKFIIYQANTRNNGVLTLTFQECNFRHRTCHCQIWIITDLLLLFKCLFKWNGKNIETRLAISIIAIKDMCIVPEFSCTPWRTFIAQSNF